MLLRADIFKSFGLTSSLCVSFMMLPYGNLKVTQHLLHESHILSTHVSYIKSLLRLHLHFSTTVSPVCSNLFYIWITEFVFPLVETMWWQRRGGGGGSFFFFFVVFFFFFLCVCVLGGGGGGGGGGSFFFFLPAVKGFEGTAFTLPYFLSSTSVAGGRERNLSVGLSCHSDPK